MASFLDGCRFTPASSGSGSFVVSTAVTGYKTPAAAQAVDQAVYKYRAESADLTQWEEGYGVYTVSTTTLTRVTILFNSLSTNVAVSFSAAPQVAIVAYAEDLVPIDGSLFGLTLSTAGSSSTFSVATGWCANSTAVNIMRLYSAYSKTTSSWAVGTGNGGLDTGAIAINTWYHVFVIKRLDTGVTDVLFSTSATSPTMPTNYTIFRRIGSIKTDGSSQWTLFSQNGDGFLWSVPVQDFASTLGTTSTLFTLTTPLGVQVMAKIAGLFQATAANIILLITSPDQATTAASLSTFNSICTIANQNSGWTLDVRTDTSSRMRAVASAASSTFYVVTFGWTDTRGRL